MELQAQTPDQYLGADEIVDHAHPDVAGLAGRLRDEHPDDAAFAAAAFEHVRDQVSHSWDAQDPRVTVTASEVLREGVGLCYGKAHLLTALLRAQGVPAGLCYQRLAHDGGFVVHGLVALHLEGRWSRQDPRGNKPGVDAQFSLAQERLAWPVDPAAGEVDDPRVHRAPHPAVVAALRSATDMLALVDGGLPADL